jgi:hypothetical protein
MNGEPRPRAPLAGPAAVRFGLRRAVRAIIAGPGEAPPAPPPPAVSPRCRRRRERRRLEREGRPDG